MRKALTILALVGVVAVIGLLATIKFEAPSQLFEDTEATMFADWKAHHNKAYFNSEEHSYRLAVFKANLKEILDHNAKTDKKFTMAVNMFSDLTSAEFIRLHTGAVKPEVLEELPQMEYDEANLATSIDWTTRGAVTPVKNQGQCGSCWAFSSTGVLETAYYLKHGSLKTFSEQQLVDCTSNYGNYGCRGGWPKNSFEYLRSSSIESESSYPYQARDGTCTSTSSRGVTKDTGAKAIQKSASQLMAALNE